MAGQSDRAGGDDIPNVDVSPEEAAWFSNPSPSEAALEMQEMKATLPTVGQSGETTQASGK